MTPYVAGYVDNNNSKTLVPGTCSEMCLQAINERISLIYLLVNICFKVCILFYHG